MKMTLSASTKVLPEGLQVESNSRNFKIIMDEPAELGGTDKGMNPLEALLCTLGACQSIVVKAFAKAKGFTYDDFYVDVEGDFDPDGFMGKNPDVRNGFFEVRYKMHFKTNEPKEKVEEFAAFVEKTCPVCDCLAAPVKTVLAGVVID